MSVSYGGPRVRHTSDSKRACDACIRRHVTCHERLPSCYECSAMSIHCTYHVHAYPLGICSVCKEKRSFFSGLIGKPDTCTSCARTEGLPSSFNLPDEARESNYALDIVQWPKAELFVDLKRRLGMTEEELGRALPGSWDITGIKPRMVFNRIVEKQWSVLENEKCDPHHEARKVMFSLLCGQSMRLILESRHKTRTIRTEREKIKAELQEYQIIKGHRERFIVDLMFGPALKNRIEQQKFMHVATVILEDPTDSQDRTPKNYDEQQQYERLVRDDMHDYLASKYPLGPGVAQYRDDHYAEYIEFRHKAASPDLVRFSSLDARRSHSQHPGEQRRATMGGYGPRRG